MSSEVGSRLAQYDVTALIGEGGIGQVYQETEDTRALVLELVEGPTLADRIKQGPIPVDDA